MVMKRQMGRLTDEREPVVTVKATAFEMTEMERRGTRAAMFAK